MKITSISVLPSAKGYLAKQGNDLFVPKYIALAVIEDKGNFIIPLAIKDLTVLSDFGLDSNFKLEIVNGDISGLGISSNIVSELTLTDACKYIWENKHIDDLENLKNEIIEMAKKNQVKYDKRINVISTFDYCKNI